MEKKYTEILNQLTVSLLKYTIRKDRNSNVVFSPVSVLMLEEMLAFSAAGDTRQEIHQAIDEELTDEDHIQLVQELKQITSCIHGFSMADAMFAGDGYADHIHEPYKENLKDLFDAEVFSGSDIFRKINEWVNGKTKGLIPELLQSDPGSVIALVNAVCFSGKWMSYYDDMGKGIFHNADGSTSHVTYLKNREGSYIENGFFTGFTKPYQNDCSFMALLPKKSEKSFLQGMLDEMNLSEIYQGRRHAQVDTFLSEFKYSWNAELIPFLEEQGISEAFSLNADFSTITDLPAAVDSVRNQSVIEVDQTGTQAASVTYSILVGSALPFEEKIYTVKLDRPFLFAIMDENGIPLFAGMLNSE